MPDQPAQRLPGAVRQALDRFLQKPELTHEGLVRVPEKARDRGAENGPVGAGHRGHASVPVDLSAGCGLAPAPNGPAPAMTASSPRFRFRPGALSSPKPSSVWRCGITLRSSYLA